MCSISLTILQKHTCLRLLGGLFSSDAIRQAEIKTPWKNTFIQWSSIHQRPTLHSDSSASSSSVSFLASSREAQTTKTSSTSIVSISMCLTGYRWVTCLRACLTSFYHQLMCCSSPLHGEFGGNIIQHPVQITDSENSKIFKFHWCISLPSTPKNQSLCAHVFNLFSWIQKSLFHIPDYIFSPSKQARHTGCLHFS